MPVRDRQGQGECPRLRGPINASYLQERDSRQRRRSEQAGVQGAARRCRDRVRPLPPLSVSFASGPDGAVVTWRPKPDPDSLVDDGRRTMFVEQDGRWLVYRCCP